MNKTNKNLSNYFNNKTNYNFCKKAMHYLIESSIAYIYHHCIIEENYTLRNVECMGKPLNTY